MIWNCQISPCLPWRRGAAGTAGNWGFGKGKERCVCVVFIIIIFLFHTPPFKSKGLEGRFFSNRTVVCFEYNKSLNFVVNLWLKDFGFQKK